MFFRRTDASENVSRSEANDMHVLTAERTGGQDPTEKSPTRQSAIWLTDRQIDWLEERCREARKNGGKAIKRAAIVRALLNVAMETPVDLKGLSQEEEIVERIRKAIVQLQ